MSESHFSSSSFWSSVITLSLLSIVIKVCTGGGEDEDSAHGVTTRHGEAGGDEYVASGALRARISLSTDRRAISLTLLCSSSSLILKIEYNAYALKINFPFLHIKPDITYSIFIRLLIIINFAALCLILKGFSAIQYII